MTRMWVISASLHRVSLRAQSSDAACDGWLHSVDAGLGCAAGSPPHPPPSPPTRPPPKRGAAWFTLRRATGSRRSAADRLPVTYSGAKGETSLPQARVMSRLQLSSCRERTPSAHRSLSLPAPPGPCTTGASEAPRPRVGRRPLTIRVSRVPARSTGAGRVQLRLSPLCDRITAFEPC